MSINFVRKYQRYGILVLSLLAAFLTPPDIITQVILTALYLVCYEAALWTYVLLASRERIRESGFSLLLLIGALILPISLTLLLTRQTGISVLEMMTVFWVWLIVECLHVYYEAFRSGFSRGILVMVIPFYASYWIFTSGVFSRAAVYWRIIAVLKFGSDALLLYTIARALIN